MPDAIVLPSSDELPLGAILALWLPRYALTDPVARAVAERRFDYSDDEIRALLSRAMVDWAVGEVADPSLPSFAMFAARIGDSLAHLRAHAETTLLVTSAGSMAAAMHLCGHARATTPAEATWRSPSPSRIAPSRASSPATTASGSPSPMRSTSRISTTASTRSSSSSASTPCR